MLNALHGIVTSKQNLQLMRMFCRNRRFKVAGRLFASASILRHLLRLLVPLLTQLRIIFPALCVLRMKCIKMFSTSPTDTICANPQILFRVIRLLTFLKEVKRAEIIVMLFLSVLSPLSFWTSWLISWNLVWMLSHWRPPRPRNPIYLSICIWLYSPCGPCPLFSFLILYTVGRTPWMGDQPVARLQPTYTTQTQNKRTQTSMPWVRLEPTIPAFERAKTVHALDRAATVVGPRTSNFLKNSIDGEMNARNLRSESDANTTQ
jgi:hypothetical protein